MIGNRLMVTMLVIFLAVGPPRADAWWFWGTTTTTTLAPETTTEEVTTTLAPETTTEEVITTLAPETTAEEVTSTISVETTSESSVETESPSPRTCPPDNSEYVSLPHETDCGLFYICNWGEKLQRECPAGLYFNAVLEVCDWPWNAGCTAK